jgi:pantothenate kinase-related protein Tda10
MTHPSTLLTWARREELALARLTGLPLEVLAHVLPWYSLLAEWALGRVRAQDTPLVLGVQGVQGSGKSTLVALLQEILGRGAELAVAALSLDDLYLIGRATIVCPSPRGPPARAPI